MGRCVLGVESPTPNQGVCGSNPGSVISLGKKFTPNFLPQKIPVALDPVSWETPIMFSKLNLGVSMKKKKKVTLVTVFQQQ